MHKKIIEIAMVIVILAMCIGVAVAAGNNPENQKPPEVTDHSPGPVVYSLQGHSARGVSYTRNETLWVASADQIIEEQTLSNLDQSSIYDNNHYSDTFLFTIRHGQYVYLVTPFVNAIDNNGIKPNVRYLWMTLKMPVGVNVTQLAIYSGHAEVYGNTNPRMLGTGKLKEYKIDLGSYHTMQQGIQVTLGITNTLATNKSVQAYGGRVRQEW